MGPEMSPFDETRQGELGDRGGVAIQQGTRNRHRLDELRRQHDITETQAGKERFGEGTDVNGTVVMIQPLDTGGRAAGLMELAVVGVLDNPGLMRLCPFDQGKASLEGEG